MRRTNFPFVHKARYWFILSAVIIAIGMAGLAVGGINWGIDFTGGTSLSIEFEEQVAIEHVREIASRHGMEDAQILQIGEEQREYSILSRSFPDDTGALYADLETLAPFELIGLDEVSGTISEELAQNALLALLVASILIVGYTSIRFEYTYGVVAIFVLIHDALITIGAFAVLGLRIESAFVVALLAILGYSINDSIVIFDRVRENMEYRKKESIDDVVNRSLNEMISRSINTSATTLAALIAILVFGGAAVFELTLALAIGILVGTYSSLFILGPLWSKWATRMEEERRRERAAA